MASRLPATGEKKSSNMDPRSVVRQTNMKRFLILFAQQNENFRVAELEALAGLYNINVDLSGHSVDTPFLVAGLESCEDAIKLVHRAVLVKAVYELYGSGNTLDEVHKQVKENYSYEYWRQYDEDSFKFEIYSHKGGHPKEEHIDMIESFKYMDLQGPIRMRNAKLNFTILEDWNREEGQLKQVWFGRYLGDSHRKYVDKYDLKKRRYIGTTSFEAELAIVTANIAQLDKGKLMYDPFAGTGSFMVAGGHFGAMSYGSDIDPRMIKGKGKATIPANFKQYGFEKLFLDVLSMDFTHNSFRNDMKFDAIVCDPPYGVREGLKVLGAKNPVRFEGKEKCIVNGQLAHLNPDYIHPKKPYQFNSLLDDLLEYSANHLVEGGRLCFWMPTSDEYTSDDIPLHPNLKYVANCEQAFTRWSRRLIVYVRRPYGEQGDSLSVRGKPVPEFREKYFRSFKDE